MFLKAGLAYPLYVAVNDFILYLGLIVTVRSAALKVNSVV